MIHISIDAPSVEAMHLELAALLGGLSKGTIRDMIEATPHAVVGIQPDEEVKCGIPPVEEALTKEPELEGQMSMDDLPVADEVPDAEEQAAEAAQETPAPKPDKPTPKMEDARAALNALRAKKGPKAVKEILTAHGVSSFVDLDPSLYATVIEEANANG